jgi:hypothetical protein
MHSTSAYEFSGLNVTLFRRLSKVMAWIDPTAAILNWFGHQQAKCKDRESAVSVDNLQDEAGSCFHMIH